MAGNLRDALQQNPQARKQFLSDVAALAQKHGVAANDPKLQSLLSTDVTDFSKFTQGLAASSIVITVTG
jgi:hypothetical protein